MLIPDELHNWLPFIELRTEVSPGETDRAVLCRKKFRTRFSIPQAFPQDGGRNFCLVPQVIGKC